MISLTRIALGLWATLLVAVGSSLTASHWSTLPGPTAADPALVASVEANRLPSEAGQWLALHVLYTECRCSQRIFEDMLASPRPDGVTERVLLIGEDPALAARLEDHGFSLESLTAEALGSRYAITAAPMLVLADPDGEIWYAGGYTDRKQGPVIRDRAIIENALSGQRLSSMPLFGCAVSESLQELLDPFGLKY